jgi:hypothetical protein
VILTVHLPQEGGTGSGKEIFRKLSVALEDGQHRYDGIVTADVTADVLKVAT